MKRHGLALLIHPYKNALIKKGKLKSARLARAENLDEETRKKYNLPKEGLVVIEIREGGGE